MNRPVMDGLEQELGSRLQFLRVNVKDPPGSALASRYQVSYTPTFLLVNARGEKEDEFLYALNRKRVLYWLNKQKPAA